MIAKPRSPYRLALLALALLAPSLGGGGASVSAGPGPAAPLPPEERFVYARTTGELRESVEISIVRKSEKGQNWYEYSSRSPDEEATYALDPTTLAVLRSVVTTRSPGSVIRRTTEILEDTAKPKPDEIVMGASGPFIQRLRLIPFADRPVYHVSFQGGPASSAFTLHVSVAGRETIPAGGRNWDCWRLEFGAGGALGGIFGAFAGKTRYWFAADWPHVLVRSEAPSGFPGSQSQRLELLTYTGPSGSPPQAGSK